MSQIITKGLLSAKLIIKGFFGKTSVSSIEIIYESGTRTLQIIDSGIRTVRQEESGTRTLQLTASGTKD